MCLDTRGVTERSVSVNLRRISSNKSACGFAQEVAAADVQNDVNLAQFLSEILACYNALFDRIINHEACTEYEL